MSAVFSNTVPVGDTHGTSTHSLLGRNTDSVVYNICGRKNHRSNNLPSSGSVSVVISAMVLPHNKVCINLLHQNISIIPVSSKVCKEMPYKLRTLTYSSSVGLKFLVYGSMMGQPYSWRSYSTVYRMRINVYSILSYMCTHIPYQT